MELILGIIVIFVVLIGGGFAFGFITSIPEMVRDHFARLRMQEQRRPTLPSAVKSAVLTPEEIDALIDEVIRLAKENLPHLSLLNETIRSFVKSFPPSPDIRSKVHAFLFEWFQSFVIFFPPPQPITSPFSMRRKLLSLHASLPDDYYTPQKIASAFANLPVPSNDYSSGYTTLFSIIGRDDSAYKPIERELECLCDTPVSIPYIPEKRFEHTVILGSAGSGKTTLLSHIILFDLHQDNPPTLILIDPKRTVIRKLSKLALFNDKLKDRLIVISPKDHPAINIFDTTNRPSSVGAIQAIEYLCGMMGQDMTGKQSGFYRNVANLLLNFKKAIGVHATLTDLLALTARKFPEKYAPVVKALPPVQRDFFESGDFESPDYRDTKDQIRSRLRSLLSSEGMSNLFTAQDNAINVFEEMDKGSIILVDTGEGDPLDKRESATFGCIFMAEIVRAILQRTPRDIDKKGHPTFVYVDEAATFFIGAEILEDFMTSGRQNNVGGIFAFHDLKMAGEDLRQTITTNTSTKILSKYAVDDIVTFGRHMKIGAEDLDAMPQYHWACAIRGVADKAVTITCAPDELDNEPPMNEGDYQAFLRKNRQRVGGKQQCTSQPPPPPPQGETSEPPHRWTEQDEQALADAEAQIAIFRRRKNWKRVDELETIIAEAKARKKASEAYYKDEEESAYSFRR